MADLNTVLLSLLFRCSLFRPPWCLNNFGETYQGKNSAILLGKKPLEERSVKAELGESQPCPLHICF